MEFAFSSHRRLSLDRRASHTIFALENVRVFKHPLNYKNPRLMMEYNQLPTPLPTSQALKGAAISIEVPNGTSDTFDPFERRYACVLNLFSIALVIALALPSEANSQVWRGTAPFCEGKCLGGERELARSSSGDGSRCITGSKALCQGANTPAACRPLQTNTECKGVVMICDNGYYTQRTNVPEWHSCARYACGACLGFWSDWKQPVVGTADGVATAIGIRSISGSSANKARLPYGPDTCKPGFVWREGTANDHVCVAPAVRDQARNDNAQRGNRINRASQPYGPDTCLAGYVWREIVPSDHVCVTPDIRERTRRENAALEANRVRGAGW
jgi:hypothetical protein